MTANESETPRTDALLKAPGDIRDAIDFARQLERELADAKREIEELRRKVQG